MGAPALACGGLRFASNPPYAGYFGFGRIHRDQVEDYARRKGVSRREIERWLAPNLGYDPEAGE
ncbi:vitamin B12 dependent-methionine synthase activation domain-containing protein [Defluviicoccus vanus]|uniref:AdoMet activation domain-containing protein n=1 Tax=Defluviicoccus vanus TaxID=111831 RepID=A0A7H1N147_9PROT|nr:vitamin B12 dependent-methionine synthase activation domain-containing protein [Defluviicoccus vanus]QNT69433.1 hypothetical protein HQ394_08985 [Defluviicoccus vanus]